MLEQTRKKISKAQKNHYSLFSAFFLFSALLAAVPVAALFIALETDEVIAGTDPDVLAELTLASAVPSGDGETCLSLLVLSFSPQLGGFDEDVVGLFLLPIGSVNADVAVDDGGGESEIGFTEGMSGDSEDDDDADDESSTGSLAGAEGISNSTGRVRGVA